MVIKSIKINKKKLFLIVFIIFILLSTIIITNSLGASRFLFWNNDNKNFEEKASDFIKWVDFGVSDEALKETAKLDIESHNNDSKVKYNWIELLSYLACKNGGNFKKF